MTLNSYKIVVFDQDEIWVEKVLKRQGADRCKSRCPIRNPSRDITKNSIPYINQVISKKMAFLRCPAQFWQFYTEFLTPYLNRTFKGIECPPYCFFCFFTVVLVDFVFFSGCWIGHISRQKKENSIWPTLNASTSAWTTPCEKIKSKFVKLMGAWPIRRSNVFMSAPARAYRNFLFGINDKVSGVPGDAG